MASPDCEKLMQCQLSESDKTTHSFFTNNNAYVPLQVLSWFPVLIISLVLIVGSEKGQIMIHNLFTNCFVFLLRS